MDGQKNERAKKRSSKVSVNGVKCVFVAHFRSSGTILKFIN